MKEIETGMRCINRYKLRTTEKNSKPITMGFEFKIFCMKDSCPIFEIPYFRTLTKNIIINTYQKNYL